MAYQHIKVPSGGEKITVNADNSLNIPDNPIIPFIEGDGIGVDITKPVDMEGRTLKDILSEKPDVLSSITSQVGVAF